MLRRIDDVIETVAIAVSVAWERRIFDGWRAAVSAALIDDAQAPAITAAKFKQRALGPASLGPFFPVTVGLLLLVGGFPALGALYVAVASMVHGGLIYRALAAADSPTAPAVMRTDAKRTREAIASSSRIVAAAWILGPALGLAISCSNALYALKGLY